MTRHRVEERSGIILIYDTEHEEYQDTPGAHADYPWVVASWHGYCVESLSGDYWEIHDWQRKKANHLCNLLNSAVNITAVKARVAELEKAQAWHPELVLVEDRGSGMSAVQTLRAQTMLPILGVPAVKSKVERAQTITGLCEARRVIIPPTEWGDVLLDELLRFPTAKHDDQVDAFVYAVQRAGNLTAGAASVTPY